MTEWICTDFYRMNMLGFSLLHIIPTDKKRIYFWSYPTFSQIWCLRPYHAENTSSRPITEVKQHWAALVLGWVTAWEYVVPKTYFAVKFDFGQSYTGRMSHPMIGWRTTWPRFDSWDGNNFFPSKFNDLGRICPL